MKLADIYNSPRVQFWMAVATAFIVVTSYTVAVYLYLEDQRASREQLHDDIQRESTATRRELKAVYERMEIRQQAAMNAINVTAQDVKESVKEASHLEDRKDDIWLKLELEKFDALTRQIDSLAQRVDGALSACTE